jgi:1,4-dihydroxy-2-naphthoate octaprenyltransferase
MFKKIFKASRPATLVVAILSTTLGIIIAYRKGFMSNNYLWNLWIIFLITLAALLLQSAINMMNNYFEEDVDESIKVLRKFYFLGYKRTEDEILTFKTGIVFFIITGIIGLYLSYYSGIQLFIIEIIGIFAAYAYAGVPFNYKRFGIGAIMSFIMMGPLMCYASYYVFSKSFAIEPILFSFSAGLFIPAILIANEIRDYEEDKSKGVRTLTVRIGYTNGIKTFYSLIIFSYIVLVLLVIFNYFPIASLAAIVTLPLVKNINNAMKTNKRKLIPETAKIYLIFSTITSIILFITK